MVNVIEKDKELMLEVLQTMITSIDLAGFHNKIVLAGASVLMTDLVNKGYPQLTRYTRDLDLSIRDKETYIELFDSIESILNNNKQGLVFNRTRTRGYNEKYQSDSLDIQCVFPNGYSVDIGIDMNIKSLQTINVTVIDKIGLSAYDINTMLADKISVVCSDMVYRRIKDVYDVFVISKVYQVDYTSLRETIRIRRPNLLDNSVSSLGAGSYEKLEHAYNKNDGMPEGVLFDEVYSNATYFLNPLLIALPLGEKEEGFTWYPLLKEWLKPI